MSVASALRHLPNQGDHSAADSVTHELALLFESFSAMLARNVLAASTQTALSAGAAAVAAVASPFRPLQSNSPTHAAPHGSAASRSTAEVSFLSISREVEVRASMLAAILILLPFLIVGSTQALRKFAAQTLMNTNTTGPSSAADPADHANAHDSRPYLAPELSSNMVLFS